MRWLDGITDYMDMSLGKHLALGDGQGGLVYCSSWGHKESDTTEQLKLSEVNHSLCHFIWVKLFVIVWTVACQAPLSMGFSRPEY